MPQVFHYTLFFDAENATPDSSGLFSFSAVELGTEAATTFPSSADGFSWPNSDLAAAPAGSRLFFSFVENSGNIVTSGADAPACWVKPIMGAPFTPTLPTKDHPQEFSLNSGGDDGNPPLLGTMAFDGFGLNEAGLTWSLKVVARVTIPGSNAPRIFRTPTSLIVLAPPPPGTAGDIFDTDVDSSGG